MVGLLTEGCSAIDAGANVGGHTWTMLRCVGETGRVLAVEPNPELAGALKLWHIQNPQLTVVPLALSDKVGTSKFYMPAGDSGYGSLFLRETRPFEIARTLTVQTARLDDLVRKNSIQDLRVIKADVEHSELAMLRGAAETLKSRRPVVFLELAWLQNFGQDLSGWPGFQSFLRDMDYSILTMLGQPIEVPRVNCLEADRDWVVALIPSESSFLSDMSGQASAALAAYLRVRETWDLCAKFTEHGPHYCKLAKAPSE